jgi:hypothetical protein
MTTVLGDLVVIAHFLYVVFVVTGGLLALKWPWIIRLHLPAALWGAFIEFSGLICPLTALENWLRVEAGVGGICWTLSGGIFSLSYIPRV